MDDRDIALILVPNMLSAALGRIGSSVTLFRTTQSNRDRITRYTFDCTNWPEDGQTPQATRTFWRTERSLLPEQMLAIGPQGLYNWVEFTAQEVHDEFRTFIARENQRHNYESAMAQQV